MAYDSQIHTKIYSGPFSLPYYFPICLQHWLLPPLRPSILYLYRCIDNMTTNKQLIGIFIATTVPFRKSMPESKNLDLLLDDKSIVKTRPTRPLGTLSNM